MSRFQDPYLAESVGFATGHSNGIAQGVGIGRQQGYSNGYSEGWNAAADEANAQLARKDKTIAELNQRLQRNSDLMKNEIDRINADRESLSQEIFALVDRINLLREKNAGLLNTLEECRLQQQAENQRQRSENEEKHMAFLGVIAMARAAMAIVSKASVEEKSDFLEHYAELAMELQTEEYIDRHRFPHNQELTSPHIPDISTILKENIFPQVKAHRERMETGPAQNQSR